MAKPPFKKGAKKPAAAAQPAAPARPPVRVRATTRAGKRALAKREPQLVEEVKATLLVCGQRVSQTVKNVLADIYKLKPSECVKLTRKNEGLHPMDAGGETELEGLARRADCGLFALGAHSKKRPHALTLGRFFDGRLQDAVEMTLGAVKSIADYGGAAAAARVAAGHKPLLFFAGAPFDAAGGDPAMVAAKSLLLDMLRGRVVEAVNLAGVDRIIVVLAPGGRRLEVRQYGVALKKSGGRVPRVETVEVGPAWTATVTRHRAAPPDLERAAHKKVEGVDKKKEKNVAHDTLDGRVGRVYVPPQDLGALPTALAKGVKRGRARGDGGDGRGKKGRAAEE